MLQVAMAAATECSFRVFPHPLYSPDLAPSDFYLFPKPETNLRGRNFGSNEDAIDTINEYLRNQDKDLFWKDKQTGTVMEKVHQDGDYFEK